MSYVIAGATGQLGHQVVQSLLDHGVEPAQIIAAGRDLSKVKDLEDRGVRTAAIDYGNIDSLRTAFAGAEKLLFISGSEAGQRLAQHRNVVEAAKDAEVGLVIYTSIAKADTSSLLLAAEHLATEKLLAESGLDHVLLRNGWYVDNYTGQLPTFVEHGAIAGSAGKGRVSAATRADFAEAAAAVLLKDNQAGKVYELGADEAFTMSELAAAVSEVSGREVVYQDLPKDAYTQVLVQAGLPPAYAEVLADSDQGIARGELLITTGDLSSLLGRPTTPLLDAVKAAYAS